MAASNGVLNVGVPSLVLPIESPPVSYVLHTSLGRYFSIKFSLLLKEADELEGDATFVCFLSIIVEY